MELPKLFKWGDLIVAIILAGLFWSVGANWFSASDTPLEAYIEINGVVKYRLKLTENQIVNLTEFDPVVKVEVNNSQIKMRENDCKSQVCLKMGHISQAGESLICVPKKILIYLPKNDDNKTLKITTG